MRRRPNIHFDRVNSKSVIMSGGINEGVTSLELRPGELFECINYEEISGPNHGYSSVEGFEVMDGRTSPTDVSVRALEDYGNDSDVAILIESVYDTDTYDKSGVGNDTDFSQALFSDLSAKFGDGSWEIDVNGHSISIDQSVNTVDFSADEWTIDGWIQFNDNTTVGTIAEKHGVWRLYISLGYLYFEFSTDGGVSYNRSIGGITQMPRAQWTQFTICKNLFYVTLGFNGKIIDDQFLMVPGLIHTNTNDIVIGGNTNKSIYLDSFRVSIVERIFWNLVVDYEYYYGEYEYSSTGYYVVNYDDNDRESVRQSINGVPGSGPIRAVGILDGVSYAIRDKAGGASSALYEESSGGWVEKVPGLKWVSFSTGSIEPDIDSGQLFVTTSGAVGTIVNVALDSSGSGSGDYTGYFTYKITSGSIINGDTVTTAMTNTCVTTSAEQTPVMGAGIACHIEIGRVSYYPRGYQRKKVMYISSSGGGLFVFNGTDFDYIRGPEDMTAKGPTMSRIFSNRLWLAYDDGQLFHSAPGDPSNFSGEFFGDLIYFGGEITNIEVAPGAVLAVIMRNSITMVKQVEGVAVAKEYQFVTEEFSKKVGGYYNTASVILGDVFFADDRGLVNMSSVNDYGDFAVTSLRDRVHKTYQRYKSGVIGSVVHRDKNQYRLFFNDGDVTRGIFYTFEEKKLKGTTIVEYPKAFTCFYEGETEDGSVKIICGDEDGFVYHMDRGTSFDGQPINTYLTTAFYHYATPRLRKRFSGILFEMSAENKTVVQVRPIFDYDESVFMATRTYEPDVIGQGAKWGQANWGEFIWSGPAVSSVKVMMFGYGVNMGVSLRSSNMYKLPHTLHNMIVDYSNGAIKN